MIDLPIAERELRTAARSLRTYNSRRNAAAVAVVVFFWLYWALGMHGGAAGAKVFGALSVLCFVYTLFAGIILTSDCVSSEKREGTLGLLFLTSLKPYDIVAGNILATSLKAFYGLLAAFPVLGISFVMGGVSHGEFTRVCLTLISALFFSLAFSLCVSCLSEKHLVATTRAALGLIFFSVILPAGCAGMRRLLPYVSFPQSLIEIFELFSPSLSLARSSSPSLALQHDFWWSLLIINAMSLGFLGFSCFILPRVCKDRANAPRSWPRIKLLGSRHSDRRHDPVRTRLLNRNPMYWLASRRSFESIKFLIGSIALCGITCFMARNYFSRFIGGKFPEFAAQTVAWVGAAIALHAILMFKFAALSSHRFAEDRKSGALELLLVTPMTVRRILSGQWLALRRQLGGPVLAVLFVHSLMFWAFLIFCGMEEGIPGGASDVLKVLWSSLAEFDQFLVPLCIGLIILGSALVLCVNWIALGWVGMWVGLRTRRPAIATWLTLALVLLPPLPIYALILLVGDWLGFSRSGAYWACFCISLGFGLEFCNALWLIGWCWHNLRRKFRNAAADRFQAAVDQRMLRIRVARRLAFSATGAILLIILFYTEEKWRGLRAWHQLEMQYAVRGQRLTTKPTIPAVPPDLENFGARTIFKPLFDYQLDEWGVAVWKNNPARQSLEAINATGQDQSPWQKPTNKPYANWALQRSNDLTNWQKFYRADPAFRPLCPTNAPAAAVLKVLGVFDPALNEIEQSSRLPYSRFPIHYDERWRARVPHRDLFQNVTQILALRAAAKLELGQNDAALHDVEFCLRLATAFRVELGIQPRRIRQVILLSALQPVWEGLSQHRWSEANLKLLQDLLRINVLEEYPDAVREQTIMVANIWNSYTESAEGIVPNLEFSPGMRAAAKFYPLGWKYLNQAFLLRVCEHEFVPLVDPAAHRVFIPNERALERANRRGGVSIDPLFHMVGSPVYSKAAQHFAHAQVSLDEAVIACALERWHQARGAFPSTLNALTPDYLDKLPIDPLSGGAYQYRLLPTGFFLLYSTGWNGRDDGGQTVSADRNSREQNLGEGDWVWGYTSK